MSTGTQLARPAAPCATDAQAAGTEEPPGHPHGVRATASIRATYNGRVTTLPHLRSDGPFHLRRMRTGGRAARVGIIGAMSAPLGGDRLTLDITADDRAELDVTTAAATLALRGPTTAPATYDVQLTAGEGAGLRWLPQPGESRGERPSIADGTWRPTRTVRAALGNVSGPGAPGRARGPRTGFPTGSPPGHRSAVRRSPSSSTPSSFASGRDA
ncbi:urease accessory protein UreD [Streptomyces sp. MMS24-I2-30]|uniref:urease accessory protein UreD n=1 Tax=Streptomyces sp. MMS24-I2-30 TaxID=3351564 RepID=UPI003896BA1D